MEFMGIELSGLQIIFVMSADLIFLLLNDACMH